MKRSNRLILILMTALVLLMLAGAPVAAGAAPLFAAPPVSSLDPRDYPPSLLVHPFVGGASGSGG